MSGTMTYLFANMLLNSRLQGVFSSILIAPLVAISIGGVFVSRRFGLKSTFLLGTWGSMTDRKGTASERSYKSRCRRSGIE